LAKIIFICVILLPYFSYIIYGMQPKNKKHTEEYEAEVVRKLRGIEEARAERELRESQDERANSFANSFESGELVS
jgi:hypothetical protein